MTVIDLPLAQHRKPRNILVFPLINRISKIRHTASKLSVKHGDETTLYWKQVMNSNRKHLERIGLSEAEIEIELTAFFKAVQCEINRQAYEGLPNGNGDHGGAA